MGCDVGGCSTYRSANQTFDYRSTPSQRVRTIRIRRCRAFSVNGTSSTRWFSSVEDSGLGTENRTLNPFFLEITMTDPVYLDHAAIAPRDPAVIEAMDPDRRDYRYGSYSPRHTHGTCRSGRSPRKDEDH